MLSYDFLSRALLVGILTSVCCSLLGVSLVLKRYSMIGDGLSHVGFGALSIAMALGYVPASSALYGAAQTISRNPMIFTTAVVVLLAFLLLKLNSSSRIKGDAAIALLSTGALALGVVVASTTKGMNIDIANYMFGSILSVSDWDARYSVAMSAAVALLFVLSYHRVFAVTFALGSGLAGLGGGLGVDVLGLDPTFPLKYMVYFLLVVAIGGAGTIKGGLVVAMILGICDVAGKYYVPQVGSFIIYFLMVTLMILFPAGLYGRRA
jgi:ABC-type Mn2+/Zn2+ transport system permease subunit